MRYLMTFSYDGTNFSGYQKQPDSRTIQEEIEKCLTMLNSNKFVSISATGRTDAKVHAFNQMAHFDLDNEIDNLRFRLNKMLPDDIYVKDVINVSDEFHARFDVKSKEYVYFINIGDYDPHKRNYQYQYNKELDVEKMDEALKLLIGEHDFKSFTKANSEIDDYVRTIYNTKVEIKDNIIKISIEGSGFLRYMVRNIVGLLIEIGEGKKDNNDVLTILEAKDRTESSPTAPPCGLYLNKINY